MSIQLWGNTDAGPSRGRNSGRVVNYTVTTTPTDVSYIFWTAEIDNFSVQLVWGAKVSSSAIKVYTSNSYVPASSGSTGGDPQDETQAYRAGNWVDTGSRWTTGFTTPANTASQGEICSQGKPVDALFVKITLPQVVASSTTDSLQWFISGKAYSK